MNRNKLFLILLFQKQWDCPAQPENPAATACIAYKSLRICERCRLVLPVCHDPGRSISFHNRRECAQAMESSSIRDYGVRRYSCIDQSANDVDHLAVEDPLEIVLRFRR